VLAGRPAWWFHPLGIETKRARALAAVARVADRLWEWAARPPAEAAGRLALLAGVGPWTIGTVLGPACGDEDAVAVGDYHLPSIVAWNLAGEPRADDARMLTLLEPYRGQRGRVIRLLSLAGRRPPAFGPRQRILPMHRW
jgi:3-methyladenine DNA glycosylase/8-oxoguanine DNA glycosylase